MSCTECGHPKLIAGRCPNCGALVDVRFTPPPQRLAGSSSHWDEWFTIGLVLFAVTVVVGAVVVAINSL